MNMTFEKIAPEPYTCTMPGICPGCAGPVMRDDDEKIQDMAGGWWHTYCRHRVLREILDYRRQHRPALTVVDPRPFDTASIVVWAVVMPIITISWIGVIIWVLFFS